LRDEPWTAKLGRRFRPFAGDKGPWVGPRWRAAVRRPRGAALHASRSGRLAPVSVAWL